MDVSSYEAVVWEEREAELCSTQWRMVCEDREQQLCEDVAETRCDVSLGDKEENIYYSSISKNILKLKEKEGGSYQVTYLLAYSNLQELAGLGF